MKNQPNNTEPLTASEIFLLMRLLQHLEDQLQLPEGQDWQTIYDKLNHLGKLTYEKR